MVNDILLWLYLHDRIQYLEDSPYVIALIWFKLATIFLAQIIMGIYMYSVRKDLIFPVFNSKSKSKSKSKWQTWKDIFVPILLFLTAPLVPCSLNFRLFALEKQKEEAMQLDVISPPSLSKSWLNGRVYDQKIGKLKSAIATFHFITASFETIPEVWILLTFLVTKHNGDISVVQDNATWFYVITIFTICTTLYALGHGSNLRKRGRLDLKQKTFLRVSFFFQVASRLSLMIASSSYTIDYVSTSTMLDNENPDSGPDSGLLYLFYVFGPFCLHWILLSIFYSFRQSFRSLNIADRIMHILSNTFIALPLNNTADEEEPTKDFEVCPENEKEESKGSEVFMLLGLTGLELVVQVGLGFFPLKFWSFDNSFCCNVSDWGTWLFPILCWALGCVFMIVFYMFSHKDWIMERIPLSCLFSRCFPTWSGSWKGSLSTKLNNFDLEKHCKKCTKKEKSSCKIQPRGSKGSQPQRNVSYSSTSFSQVRMRMLHGDNIYKLLYRLLNHYYFFSSQSILTMATAHQLAFDSHPSHHRFESNLYQKATICRLRRCQLKAVFPTYIFVLRGTGMVQCESLLSRYILRYFAIGNFGHAQPL